MRGKGTQHNFFPIINHGEESQSRPKKINLFQQESNQLREILKHESMEGNSVVCNFPFTSSRHVSHLKIKPFSHAKIMFIFLFFYQSVKLVFPSKVPTLN